MQFTAKSGFLTLTFVLVAFSCALTAAASPTALRTKTVASYCSPSGDVCYGVFQKAGNYQFKLTLAAKYFARYRICIVPLGQTKTCKSFPVKKTGAQWGGTVIWQRNFPVRGPRRYKVSWLQGTHRLGPVLAFNLPAP